MSSNPLPLPWQSRTVLWVVCAAATVNTAFQLTHLSSSLSLSRPALDGAVASLLMAALVLGARAATPGAAAVGALLAFCYALTPGAPHSPLWLLFPALVLAIGASRIGRARKEAQGTAEGKRGRSAAQVAANLGVGALAGVLVPVMGTVPALALLLAAVGETAADTLASELGQLARGTPRLLLTGKRVPTGTDGAVSLPGTLAGLGGAAFVCLLGQWVFALPWPAVALGGAGAVFGFFFDSVLGQVAERRGLLNNDAVNFLSTLAAALFVLGLGWLL